MAKFIGYTIGLEANKSDIIGKMVKASYERNEDGSVKIQATNGRTLGALPGIAIVTGEEFENRPFDFDDGAIEARWALNKTGWTLMSDDAE